jgi:hypothetical protein
MGSVQVAVAERSERVALWIRQAFLAGDDTLRPHPSTAHHHAGGMAAAPGQVLVAFECVRPATAAPSAPEDPVSLAEPLLAGAGRGGDVIVIEANSAAPGGGRRGIGCLVRISGPRMALVAEVFADMAAALELDVAAAANADTTSATPSMADDATAAELPLFAPRASFPREREWFRALLAAVREADKARVVRAAVMADAANAVKALVVRAEDARILGDVAGVRRSYARLINLNAELLQEHNTRAAQVTKLKNALRAVNSLIQVAGKLQLGAARGTLVADARKAVKDEQWESLATLLVG